MCFSYFFAAPKADKEALCKTNVVYIYSVILGYLYICEVIDLFVLFTIFGTTTKRIMTKITLKSRPKKARFVKITLKISKNPQKREKIARAKKYMVIFSIYPANAYILLFLLHNPSLRPTGSISNVFSTRPGEKAAKISRFYDFCTQIHSATMQN